jgi:hypothetical protein
VFVFIRCERRAGSVNPVDPLTPGTAYQYTMTEMKKYFKNFIGVLFPNTNILSVMQELAHRVN